MCGRDAHRIDRAGHKHSVFFVRRTMEARPCQVMYLGFEFFCTSGIPTFVCVRAVTIQLAR